MSHFPVFPADEGPVDLCLPREEAEALLLALDALQPLLERIRAEIAPEPEPDAALSPFAADDRDDALRRATRLARQSLREARAAIGERRPTAAQRRAWQEAARRYVGATRRSIAERARSGSR